MLGYGLSNAVKTAKPFAEAKSNLSNSQDELARAEEAKNQAFTSLKNSTARRAMVKMGFVPPQQMDGNTAAIAGGVALLAQALGARPQYAQGALGNFMNTTQALNNQEAAIANQQAELDYQSQVNQANADVQIAGLDFEQAQGKYGEAQKQVVSDEQRIQKQRDAIIQFGIDEYQRQGKHKDALDLLERKAAFDKELEGTRAQNKMLESQEKASQGIAEFDKFRQYAAAQGLPEREAWEFAMRMTQPSQILSPYQQAQIQQEEQRFDLDKYMFQTEQSEEKTSKEYEERFKQISIDIGIAEKVYTDAKKKAEDLLKKASKSPANVAGWDAFAKALSESVQAESELKKLKDDYDRLIGEQNRANPGNQPYVPGGPLPSISGKIGK